MYSHKFRSARSIDRVVTLISAVLLTTTAAAAQCSTLYSELQSPLGITQSNTGNLLAAESGTLAPNSGRISVVDLAGNRRTLLSGLPSGINDVGGPSGPSGLFQRGRTLYVAMGVGDVALPGPLPGSTVANPNPSSVLFSSVLALTFSISVETRTTGFTLTSTDQQTLAARRKVTLSDELGEHLYVELLANFPDYVPKPLPGLATNVAHSNPFALLAVGDRLYVTDGGMNKIWQVDLATGSFSTLTVFPNIPNPLYPAVGGPFEEAVPTGIAYAGGRLLVTLFRGVPFAQETSTIEQVNPATGAHSALTAGLTTAIGILPVARRADTDYLVLQFASTGPFFGGPGLLLQFPNLSSPGSLVTNCLMLATSMALDAKRNTLYVAELGGRIVTIPFAP
jgi:hypothetical protein